MTSNVLRERILTWVQARYTVEQTAKLLSQPTAKRQTVVDRERTTEKERA